MKQLVFLVTLAVVGAVLAGSSFAQGALALYADMGASENTGSVAIGNTFEIHLFYVRGGGPAMGAACEFKLVLSSPNVEFLSPVWSSEIVATIGTISEGIAVTAGVCMSQDIYGHVSDIVHIGTIPIRNLSETAPFSVSVQGFSASTPLITVCDAQQSIQEVQGGQFWFNTFLLLMQAEATAPQLISARFNNPVTAETAEIAANYSVFATGNPLESIPVSSASLQDDQRTVLLTMGEALSQDGAYSLTAANVQDPNGHLAAPWRTVPVALRDWTPPRMTAVTVLGGNSLELAFSEALQAAEAGDPINYALFETLDPASVVAVTGASLQPGGTLVRIALAAPLAAGTSYTARAVGVKDTAGNVIGSAGDVVFVMPDIYPPVLLGVEVVNPLLLRALFSEQLDPASAIWPSNYLIYRTANPGYGLVVTAVQLSAGGTAALLTLATEVPPHVSYTLTVTGVADTAGNIVAPGGGISFIYDDAALPTLVSAAAPADSVVLVTFSEDLEPASAENAGNYEIFETAQPANTVAVTNAALAGGAKEVRLSLGGHLSPGVAYTLRCSGVKDLGANVIAPGSEAPLTFLDVVPPALVSARALGGSTIELQFSEPLDGATAENPANYAVYDDLGGTLALYADMAHSITSIRTTGAFEAHNLYLFYVRNQEAFMGQACEFRLSCSTDAIIFGSPIWSNQIVLTLGSIPGGIALTSRTCMSKDINGNDHDAVYIGTIPVYIVGNQPTTISVAGFTGADPRITICDPGQSIREVQGGRFTINGSPNGFEACAEQVTAATLTGAQTVTLTIAGSLRPMTQYTIVASNVQDPAGNTIASGMFTGDLIPFSITHTPITCARTGSDLYVQWQVTDPLHSVASTCLYYRPGGSTEWIEQCENNPINPVVMAVPGSAIGAAGIEYCITATNGIGVTVQGGDPADPIVAPACPPVTCQQPILSLTGYMSVSYVAPVWKVRVYLYNAGPGTAKNVNVTMNSDISWLAIPDPFCAYGDVPAGSVSLGEIDGYSFDLSSSPGGSFNAWFDVAYADSCGNSYRVRLDPEFSLETEESGGPEAIGAYRLEQNYPNPFNPSTSIGYQVPAAATVVLRIFDVSGRLVRTLVNESKSPGAYVANWDGMDGAGRAAASGIYFCKFQAGEYIETRRMVLLR